MYTFQPKKNDMAPKKGTNLLRDAGIIFPTIVAVLSAVFVRPTAGATLSSLVV